MKRPSPLTILFTAAAFLGAFSIFVVEPLVAKILLPQYGGSSSVWTTASFYFQLVLLLGYSLVHLTMKLKEKKQLFVFVPLAILAVVLVTGAFTYPVAPEGVDHTLWLVWSLLTALTLPFLALGVTSPLLQKWYSRTTEKRASDPYFLYAASNIGSFGGLLAYPLLIEANIPLQTQQHVWFGLFITFVLLMVGSYIFSLRSQAPPVITKVDLAEKSPKPTVKRQLAWVGMAFLPSSLMLGFTSYVSTDLGSFPFLWLIPLSLYLIAMTVAFAMSSRKVPQWLFYLTTAVLVATTLGMGTGVFNQAVNFSFGILALILVSFLANRLLASQRPHTDHLTRFYLLLSLGGALGGAFNSLLAPVIFNSPIEYPLVLGASLFLIWLAPKNRFIGPAFGAVAILLIPVFGTFANPNQQILLQDRTFYGTYKVLQQGDNIALIHGVTLHGTQSLITPDVPTTYYSENSGVGLLMAEEPENVTVVGLGTGTLATYGQPGQKLNFIEIDGDVAKIAEDEKYFTYLSDSKADVDVLIGDGRLLLNEFEDNSQELIVVDAFSSDSIPAHLITKEATALYLDKLTDDGTLLFHISNNYFDLLPVVTANAEANGLEAYDVWADSPDGVTSHWVAISKDEDKFKDSDVWEKSTPDRTVLWTDDYSSLLSVFVGLKK